MACIAAACAGAAGGVEADVATDEEWRALRHPRPEPLAGAPRVTVSGVDFLGVYPWPAAAGVPAELGVAELVAAGLLRRRDIEFVERRRFSAAAEAERAGMRRQPGQPPAGVSRSVDFSATAVWIPVGGASAAVEVRLVRLETGGIAGATRLDVDADADAVTLARTIVRGALQVLDELGRLPSWSAPSGTTAGGPAAVGTAALGAFFRGLAAEEGWRWEEARRGYRDAARDPGFYEAAAALARTARLRLGGTLAESRP